MLKDLIKDKNEVMFTHYRAGFFYYSIPHFGNGNIYEFPVPIEDVGTNATMGSSDKAITFMRWIRKAIEDNTLVKIHDGSK